jgi:hypothetical protein
MRSFTWTLTTAQPATSGAHLTAGYAILILLRLYNTIQHQCNVVQGSFSKTHHKNFLYVKKCVTLWMHYSPIVRQILDFILQYMCIM